MYPIISYDEKVFRKVLKVYEDEMFIIDLSWIDDEVSMKENNFKNYEIIDRNIKYKKFISQVPFTIKLEEHESQGPIIPKKQGRHRLPRTEDLPINRTVGRPTIESFSAKNLFFGKSQGSKPIISNEDVKHYRLVILNPLKVPNEDIKYGIKEVSTFYLQKGELDKMKELSWHLISNNEIGYFNPDLKLTKDYVLPADFLPDNFYTEESMLNRVKFEYKQIETSANLNEMVRPYKEYYEKFRDITDSVSLKSKIYKEAESELRKKYFSNKEGSVDLANATVPQLTDFYQHLEDFRRLTEKELEKYRKTVEKRQQQENERRAKKEKKIEERRKNQKLYGLGDNDHKILIDANNKFDEVKEGDVDMDELLGEQDF